MRAILVAFGIALAGCQSSSEHTEAQPSEDCSAVPNLDPGKAVQDAQASWRGRDMRLLGVYGYALDVPGAEDTTGPVRTLHGTSDDGCIELNERARRYAAAYNKEILRLDAM